MRRRKAARFFRKGIRAMYNTTRWCRSQLSVPLLGVDRRIEVKSRGNGFKQLYEWLNGADFLIVRQDRAEPLVVIPFWLATEIAQAAENSRASEDRAGRFPANDEVIRSDQIEE